MAGRIENTKWFLGILADLQADNANIAMYKKHFDSLSDEAYTELMGKLADGSVVLPYYCANLASKDVEVKVALEVGDKLGLDFFQQLWLTDPVSGVTYLTPEKYFIIHLPVRRQAQHVSKGKSITENSNYIDSLTGQPSGASKSSRLSLPEIMNLDSMNLHSAIEEMISVRGGNEKKFREAKRSTLDTGKYTLENVNQLNTKVTSTESLRSLLLGMHLSSNL